MEAKDFRKAFALLLAIVVVGCFSARKAHVGIVAGKHSFRGAVPQKFEIPAPGAVRPAGWIRDAAIAQRDGCTARMDEVDGQFRMAWRDTTRPRGKDMAWNAEPGAWSCEGGA